MLSKESTTLRRKAFKEEHPLFTKTDLAKYENTWDQLPYQVSEGAQKNFKIFTVRLNERGRYIPDEIYYQRLIAKAILFRRTEQLVQQQQYGGYRANIVTYTLAYLSFKTAQRIDLESIWKTQSVSPALENNIISVSKFVHELITNPPNGANIGEWCKKKECWELIKKHEYVLTAEFRDELIEAGNTSPVVSSASSAETSSFNTANEEEVAIIERAASIDSLTWFSLSKWAKETNNFQGWQRSIVFSVGQIIARGKKPSYKQSVQALKVYDEAESKGFKLE